MVLLSPSKYLLLVLSLLGCCILSNAQQGNQYCNSTSSKECGRLLASPDLIYNPPNSFESVCAYYSQNCPFSICGNTLYSATQCYICSDPTVEYYTIGACNYTSVEVVQCGETSVYSSYCGEDADYKPVCAWTNQNCTGNACSQTFPSCGAANCTAYPWYQAGACEKDKTYCSSLRSKQCNDTKADPVCAFWTPGEEPQFLQQFATAQNGCEACTDPTVIYYISDACGTVVYGDNYCLPNIRPKTCGQDKNPVCGSYYEQDGDISNRVNVDFDNPCDACMDSRIVTYVLGGC